ncbi:MAG: two-component system, OmpR family, sensor histidine kinase KdpD, partial [Solirubrobacteraceae bacterium]|nr:two-component system, OmpR family, sensor histidine kinase KdpD [Solirubrobacteraceae bacterium]
MRTRSRSPFVGLLVAGLAVAATTGVIFAIRPHVPVLSTGVLYLLAVLLVSSTWGLWLGVLTSVASAIAFGFFHIPPTGRFEIVDAANWVGLGVYLIVALVVSAFADSARARAEEAELGRREADLAAELALVLLGADPSALDKAAERIGAALGTDGVRLEDVWLDGDPSHQAIPLVASGDRVGTLLLPRQSPADGLDQVGQRLAPALGALLDARRRRAVLEGELVETKALRRSDVLKTALLRAVSHDLRSPLTAISTAAGALGSPTLDPDERSELTDVITTETQRLTRLVEDLLDLSRLESGNAEPRPEPSSIDEVLDAATRAPSLRDARLDIELADDLPPVQADPVQLERVLSNLLENAVRYSSNGEPVAVRASTAGTRLQLRITDHGPGIAAEDLERIFEPFYRAP